MFKSDSGLDFINILTTGTGGAHGGDFDIFVIDFDFDIIFDIREDLDSGEGGMSSVTGIEGRVTNESMDPGF